MSTSATASGKHRKRQTADGRTRSEHGAPRTVGPQALSRSCVRLFLTKGQSATPAPPANGTGRVTDARVRGGDCKGCCAPSVLPAAPPLTAHSHLSRLQALRAASTHVNSPTASRRPPCRHRPRPSLWPPPSRPASGLCPCPLPPVPGVAATRSRGDVASDPSTAVETAGGHPSPSKAPRTPCDRRSARCTLPDSLPFTFQGRTGPLAAPQTHRHPPTLGVHVCLSLCPTTGGSARRHFSTRAAAAVSFSQGLLKSALTLHPTSPTREHTALPSF